MEIGWRAHGSGRLGRPTAISGGPDLPLLFWMDWQLDALNEGFSLPVHTANNFHYLHLDTYVHMEWEKTKNREMPPTNVASKKNLIC
jgi:hypothetical protein